MDDKIKVSGGPFVRVSDPDDRKKLIETLEGDGFKLDEEFPLSRQDVLESNLPIIVDIENKIYGRMGNVTCAAAAAQSGKVIDLSEFYASYNSFVNRKEQP